MPPCHGRFLASPDRVAWYADLDRWVVAVGETEPDAYRRAFDEPAATLIGPLT